MSKPNTHDKIAAIDIVNGWIELNIRNGFETDEVRRELARIQQTLETRKQKLLAPPAPKKPKAARKRDSKAQAETVSSEPIARYEPDTSNLNRRGRYGRNESA